MRIEHIPLDQIVLPSHLHRLALDPDALRVLANSIHDDGLLQPIIVEPLGDRYILRAGHRRLEAYKLLHLPTIAAHVRDGGDMTHGEVVTWAENFQREDLSPIEEARALARMVNDHHVPIATIAAGYHCSEEWIIGRLELLALPHQLQDLVHTRELTMTSARELARVADPNHRDYLLRYVLQSGASSSVVRSWVDEWCAAAARGVPTGAARPPEYVPGETAVLMMPCAGCHSVVRHDHMRILRMCAACAEEIDRAPLAPPDD